MKYRNRKSKYYVQLHTYKFSDLGEMDKIFLRYRLLKLTQEERDNRNSHIYESIKTKFKTLSIKKTPGSIQMASFVNSSKYLRKK